jgi:hypothetical protein
MTSIFVVVFTDLKGDWETVVKAFKHKVSAEYFCDAQNKANPRLKYRYEEVEYVD